MARLIYIFAFIAVCVATRAQQKPVYPPETVVVSTNSTGLLAGETLYYSVFCLNAKSFSDVSKIAYVELIDSNREVVARQKITLENGVGGGDIFIPATLESGNYKLTCFTKYMIDVSDKNFFVTGLTIVNTFRKFDGVFSVATNSDKSAIVNSPDFFASLDKRVYGQREKAVIKFDGNTAGHFSISVKKAGFGHVEPMNVLPPEANSSSALPELRGALLTGSISSDKSKKLAEKAIALSVPGDKFGFKIAQTDRLGRFTFVLDQLPSRAEAIVQVFEPNHTDYKITIDEHKRPDYSQLEFAPFQLSDPDKTAIAQRAVAAQIENAYFESKKDSIAPPFAPEPFFHPLEKVYVLDDYTRFPSVRETLIEVVNDMYFTKNRDKYEIHLRNTTMNNEQFGPPLILVDGLLVQDHSALFAYPAKQIDRVSLINEPYVYGPRTFSGVANFTTKTGDFKDVASGDYIKKISLELPQLSKKYFQPDYSLGQSRIPDYRHQLLWLPDVSWETSEIGFYTSDITGEFEVIIRGFTTAGTPIFYRTTFEVK